MTVVAWDGKTLAADKRATKFGIAYTVTKIFRVNGQLVGVVGDATRGMELIHWLTNGGDPATYPPLKDNDCRAHLLVIDRDRKIKLYEHTQHAYVVEDEKWAEGEGRDFALSAMHMGKTAREAVEWASKFMSTCGNGVDELTPDE